MDEAMEEIPERWSYDVFVSFHGPDVRHGFLSHLYQRLKHFGVNVFLDDQELVMGDDISLFLSRAIENSKVLLVVLSEKYAASSWCLDELLHIMESSKTKSGQIAIPVFYRIEPSVVRHQLGSYDRALSKHESRYPESKVRKWKEALEEVAGIKGSHTSNSRDESTFIEELVDSVRKFLSSSYLNLPKYAVGIKLRINHISEIISLGSDDVRTIGICGMGGTGETTLAKAAYNEFSDSFEGTSFLENFGKWSKKLNGKVHLQRKLFSDIMKRYDKVFLNLDHEVKHRFRNKRVLVVIDDVEDKKQLDSVAIELSWFGPGSRIIITTRNERVLEELGVAIANIYSPEQLNYEESLALVSQLAFRLNNPPEGFRQLSENLVKYCRGLPLAVEVLSAFLYKRPLSDWESTLEKLEHIPDRNIQAKLQISFDTLDAVEQYIFLDISCFFIGMDKDYVSCILDDGWKLNPAMGLRALNERCLITVRDNRLFMHDLLRDMGRQIVRGTNWNNCERWSRLWDHDDVIGVLRNKNGTSEIEGLSLKAEEVTPVEDLDVEAFSNLKKLRLLQLSDVQLKGSYENFPRCVRWLSWFGYTQHSIPTNFHLGSLVVMDMQYSNLKRLWDDQKLLLVNLKYLDLSHSTHLTDTPDFSSLPNLEKLLLVNCQSLVRVHNSIEKHRKLILLNLKGCTQLGDLPLGLYKLKSLESLIISGCSQLERLDDGLGQMESLKTLQADYTAITKIPSSIDQLKKLEELSLEGCKGLPEDRDQTHSVGSPQAALSIPPSLLIRLSCLKTLRLGFCNLSDEFFPGDLGSLSCLEELDLQGNNFRNLQLGFAGFSSLLILKVDGCSELQSICSLPKSLRSFYASNCNMLERTPDLSECSELQSLHLTNCSSIVETPGLDKLKTVGFIHMEMCNRISDTYKERIMQGWAVSANGGIFIPGSSLPNWVSLKSEIHSISFTVPETSSPALVGFSLWALYESQQNNVMSEYSPKITVKNQSKRHVWRRNPATDRIRMYQKRHIWQGYFSNKDFFFEKWDQGEISVDFGDQVTILEIGLTFAYREENTDNIR